jgi:hypothetical protein
LTCFASGGAGSTFVGNQKQTKDVIQHVYESEHGLATDGFQPSDGQSDGQEAEFADKEAQDEAQRRVTGVSP